MVDFIKKNIFIIILFTITLFIGFVTFLTFIDKSFIQLNEKNLQILLISNIVLLVVLFIFIFLEIKKTIKKDIDIGSSNSNKRYIAYFSLFTLAPSILISIFSIYSGIKIINKKDEIAQSKSKTLNLKTIPQWIFLFILTFLGIYTILVTDHLQYLGKIFPISVGIFMITFCFIIGVQMYFSNTGAKVFHDAENLVKGKKEIRNQWLTIFWFISPLFLSIFIGFFVSIGFFVIIFLNKIAKKNKVFSILSGILVWIFLSLISHFMVMDFPPGILQSYIELPWPLS